MALKFNHICPLDSPFLLVLRWLSPADSRYCVSTINKCYTTVCWIIYGLYCPIFSSWKLMMDGIWVLPISCQQGYFSFHEDKSYQGLAFVLIEIYPGLRSWITYVLTQLQLLACWATLCNSIVVIPAALPEIIVLTMARATASPSASPEMVNWEPPLNAKNPNIKMKPPRAASYNAVRCWFTY